MIARTEQWTKGGRTAIVQVDHHEVVSISYEILAGMLAELGWSVTYQGPGGA